ncbi:MAG TPA: hypothetical protein VHT24_08010 [Pseudacidobacterium sp.]|jgi:hypothetical protein|nr:hypothetical protein [Pseudacidobacterium sp.]
MSTLSHPLKQPTDLYLVNSASRTEDQVERFAAPVDDGLGSMRGLAFVMVFNVVLILMAVAAWGLWHLLR